MNNIANDLKRLIILAMILKKFNNIANDLREKNLNSLQQPRTDAPCPDPCGQLGSICGTLAN